MISVVIQAKNEQHNISAIIRYVRPYAYEIVVIDGHSTDATREVSETEGAKVFLDEGKGKGSGEHWVAVVKAGRIMFEMAGVPEEVAREAMRLAAAKLPIATKIVKKQGL